MIAVIAINVVSRDVLPFLLAMVVALILIITFPQLALVLPNSMYG